MQEKLAAFDALLQAFEQMQGQLANMEAPNPEEAKKFAEAGDIFRQSRAQIAAVRQIEADWLEKSAAKTIEPRKESISQKLDEKRRAARLARQAPSQPPVDADFGERVKRTLLREFGDLRPGVVATTEKPRMTFEDWANSSRDLLLSLSASYSSITSRPAADPDDRVAAEKKKTLAWFKAAREGGA